MLDKLLALRAVQLQGLAAAIGTPSSGTKKVIATRLWAALQQPKYSHEVFQPRHAPEGTPSISTQEPHILLSIDMGIRNLAYCALAIPPFAPPPHPLSSTAVDTTATTTSCSSTDSKSRPTLISWSRLAVSNPVLEPDKKEAFDLKSFATLANHLVRELVISQSAVPQTILIERQRFRTMGSSAVQEWTLRVNVFEAMLWAVIEAARQAGTWTGSVWAVEPARVAKWWIGKDGGINNRPTVEIKSTSAGRNIGKSPAQKVKQGKIDVVGRLLESSDVMHFNEETTIMRNQYLHKWKGRRSLPGEEKMGKLDDLADCLLQGYAWFQWQENRRLILAKGLDEFIEIYTH